MQANVVISFEVENRQDADAKIATWTLHDGCSMSMSISDQSPPLEYQDGKLSEVKPPEMPES
jgi:hypothetical protein